MLYNRRDVRDMKKNISTKIIIVFLIILITNIFVINNSYSVEYDDKGHKITHGVIDPETYEPDSLDSADNADTLKNIGNDIIGFLQIVGSILSVVVLVVLGIKYMMGSVEERAEYKKSMEPYVLGAVLVFAITNILGIIAKISQDLF